MKVALRILILASLACMGMGSCSSSVDEVCHKQMPELTKQLEQITQEVALLAPRQADRAIASVGEEVPPFLNSVVEISREQKDQWQNWSEKRLAQVEGYIDALRVHNEYRRAIQPLSEIANDLVKFDGFVDQGKAYQALAVLRQARVSSESVIKFACH